MCQNSNSMSSFYNCVPVFNLHMYVLLTLTKRAHTLSLNCSLCFEFSQVSGRYSVFKVHDSCTHTATMLGFVGSFKKQLNG